MTTQFGIRIKQLRKENNLLQRQVASQLEIDTPMLSKIERGERIAKKEQVLRFAQIFNSNKDELLTLWLADQVFEVVKNEDLATEVLKNVSTKIKSPKKKK